MNQKILSKEQFLSQLRHQLRNLPLDEIDNAITYYGEYLDEAGEEHLEETLRTLGSPSEVAAIVRANRAQQESGSPPPSKKGISPVWLVILGILASPVILPLAAVAATLIILIAIVVFSVLIILCCVLLTIVVTIAALCLGLILGGIYCMCLSIPLFFQHLPTAFFFAGCGIAASGVGLLLFPLMILTAKLTGKGIVALLGRGLPKLMGMLFSWRKRKSKSQPSNLSGTNVFRQESSLPHHQGDAFLNFPPVDSFPVESPAEVASEPFISEESPVTGLAEPSMSTSKNLTDKLQEEPAQHHEEDEEGGADHEALD